jgi:alkylation response protein AidB-like acyl-CoA dehydrogenase
VNLALSDEQVLLRESARGMLGRRKTVEAARSALLDLQDLPDLWPDMVGAGWPGLLVSEEHGGAGLGGFEGMLIAEECGRVLASTPLLGLLPARDSRRRWRRIPAGDRRRRDPPGPAARPPAR